MEAFSSILSTYFSLSWPCPGKHNTFKFWYKPIHPSIVTDTFGFIAKKIFPDSTCMTLVWSEYVMPMGTWANDLKNWSRYEIWGGNYGNIRDTCWLEELVTRSSFLENIIPSHFLSHFLLPGAPWCELNCFTYLPCHDGLKSSKTMREINSSPVSCQCYDTEMEMKLIQKTDTSEVWSFLGLKHDHAVPRSLNFFEGGIWWCLMVWAWNALG